MTWLRDYIFHWSAIIEAVFLYNDWIYPFSEKQSAWKEEIEYYNRYIRIASNCRLAFSLCILFFNNKYKLLEYGHVLVTHCVLRLLFLVTILRAEHRLHLWIVPFQLVIGAGVEMMHLLYLYVVEKDMLNWERWKTSLGVGKEKEKEELDELTLIVCGKLADGWRKMEKSEMTEEEMEKKEQELKEFYELHFPNN